MSHEQNMTMTAMHWRPQLIRLTGVYDGFDQTDVYIDPQTIGRIYRSDTKLTIKDDEQTTWIVATVIVCGGSYIHVKEKPSEVARLVGEAFGYKSEAKLKAV